MSGNERADGPDEVGSGGVPPEEFVARLARGEHPATEMYTIMKPVPNSMPVPDDADEWIAAFGRVITGGHLPGGDGKTSMTMVVDTDPQGTAATPLGGPEPVRCGERTEWGTCTTPVGMPAPGCPNPFNHQRVGHA